MSRVGAGRGLGDGRGLWRESTVAADSKGGDGGGVDHSGREVGIFFKENRSGPVRLYPKAQIGSTLYGSG